jgi:roadblock/LC7 domain-containing protein
MNSGFVLLTQGRRLLDWQAKALRLLLDEGLLLRGIITTDAMDAGQSQDIVPENILTGDVPHVRIDDLDELQCLSGEDIRFVLCTCRLDTIPTLPFEPVWGYWFWQFGNDAPGYDERIAIDELTRRERVVEARMLCRQTGDDKFRELYQGRFPLARHSTGKSRERVISSCPVWPLLAFRKLTARPDLHSRLPIRTYSLDTSAVSQGSRLRLLFSLGLGAVVRTYEEFLKEEKWTIGIIDKTVADLLTDGDISTASWQEELPGSNYLADPLAVSGEDNLIFAEEFDASVGLGHIVAIEPGKIKQRKVLLRDTGHFSFPFTVRDSTGMYCMPEQNYTGKVVRYPLTLNPLQLGSPQILIDDLPGVDCVFFQHGGYWWMFGGDNRDQDLVKLFAWYSTSLQGPWQPHALNPIKTDISAARPAGPLFEHDGQLYRPAQDCSASYGSAVAIHRILELTPDSFEEELVQRLVPLAGSRYPDGLHTICAMGERTVFDVKRHTVSLRKAIRAAQKYIDKALGK